MRIFVIVVCGLVIVLTCFESTSVNSESSSVLGLEVPSRWDSLNRLFSSKQSDAKEERNQVNYEVYVTPVMSRHVELRAKNPLLSWLANVLNFGGAQSEVEQNPEPKPGDCPKCSKYMTS